MRPPPPFYSQAYKAKFRNLHFNLKDGANPDLRRKVRARGAPHAAPCRAAPPCSALRCPQADRRGRRFAHCLLPTSSIVARQVLKGEVPPGELVELPPEELASDAKKDENQVGRLEGVDWAEGEPWVAGGEQRVAGAGCLLPATSCPPPLAHPPSPHPSPSTLQRIREKKLFDSAPSAAKQARTAASASPLPPGSSAPRLSTRALPCLALLPAGAGALP